MSIPDNRHEHQSHRNFGLLGGLCEEGHDASRAAFALVVRGDCHRETLPPREGTQDYSMFRRKFTGNFWSALTPRPLRAILSAWKHQQRLTVRTALLTVPI